MNVKTKLALKRFGKVIGAAVVAAALAQIPGIDFGHYSIFLPVVTAILLGAEKYLTAKEA